MVDLTHITKFIFEDKSDYKKLTDEDKEKFFFIINRKLARAYPKNAQYFNIKGADKASAMDIWYQFFIKKRTIGIPDWYWGKKKEAKEKAIATKDEIQYLMNFYDIKERDVDFLIQYYPDDVTEELKKYRKFEK